MKLKMFFTVLCLCLGICGMAQDNGRGHRGNRGAESPKSFDMVVDTAIINAMELEPDMIAEVLQLQAQKQEELKAILIKMAQTRKEGQNFDKQAIDDMRQQMDDFKLEYRMALRKILGTANYITYLEKQVDKRQAMRPGNTHPNRDNRARGSMNPGMGQNQGNWGNMQGNANGNNWTEDNNNFGDTK